MSIGAVVFDLFGTLLDITSLRDVVATATGSPQADAIVARWREKQIAYSFAATLMDRYENFDTITALALDYALASFGVTLDARAKRALAESWTAVTPYADALATLQALKARKLPTAVLTNGTPATAKRAIANAGLDGLLDHVWSADTVRRFKPASEVYALAPKALGIDSDAIAFVSSNGWDATGASAFGFTVVWCNRGGLPAETLSPPPALTVTSLADFPAVIDRL